MIDSAISDSAHSPIRDASRILFKYSPISDTINWPLKRALNREGVFFLQNSWSHGITQSYPDKVHTRNLVKKRGPL